MPTIHTMMVLVTSQMLLAKALMYLVTVTPVTLKVAIEKTPLLEYCCTQDAEECEPSVGEGLCEIVSRVLNEGHSSWSHDAGVDAESAGDVGHDNNEDDLDAEAEETLISYHLQWLYMIF